MEHTTLKDIFVDIQRSLFSYISLISAAVLCWFPPAFDASSHPMLGKLPGRSKSKRSKFSEDSPVYGHTGSARSWWPGKDHGKPAHRPDLEGKGCEIEVTSLNRTYEIKIRLTWYKQGLTKGAFQNKECYKLLRKFGEGLGMAQGQKITEHPNLKTGIEYQLLKNQLESYSFVLPEQMNMDLCRFETLHGRNEQSLTQ